MVETKSTAKPPLAAPDKVETKAPETTLSSQSGRRRQRQPLGTPRMKLSLSEKAKQHFKDRGEVLRWINDDHGRLEAATQEDSYRHVSKDELYGTSPIPVGEGVPVTEGGDLGSVVSRVVGTRRDGSPVTAYLMAKPEEDYEEDMATKRSLIDGKEDAMKRGMTEPVENMYIPSTGIKIVNPGSGGR